MMMMRHPLFRRLTSHPAVPGISYLALIGILAVITVLAAGDIYQRYAALDEAVASLSRLEAYARVAPVEADNTSEARPAGSAFLEGESITQASAALLQRLTGAIARSGGNVQSSEIELQSGQSSDGYVRATASFELEHQRLQQLLYEIEAGMPFLYIAQLSIRTASPDDDRVKVLLGVSGLWRQDK